MNLMQLKAARLQKANRMKELVTACAAEVREPSVAENTELASLKAEIAKFDNLIQLSQQVEDTDQRLASETDRVIDPPMAGVKPLATASGAGTGTPAVAGGQQPRSPHVQVISSGREHLPYKSLGEQFIDIAHAAMGGARDPRLDIIHKAAVDGMNTIKPGEGGYIMQTDFSSDLIRTTFELSDLASQVVRIPIGAGVDTIKIPYIKDKNLVGGSVVGGFLVYLSDEAKQIQASQIEFGVHTLTMHEMHGMTYATNTMLRNAPMLTSWIQQGFTTQYAYMIEKQILYGNPANSCLGMLSDENPALLKIDKKVGQANGSIVFDNINKLQNRFWTGSRQRRIWLAGVDTEEALPLVAWKEESDNPYPAYLPANGIAGDGYSTLYGKPVKPNILAPALGQQGDLACIDPKMFWWADQGAPEMATSIHVRFDTNQSAFRFTYYFTGRPAWEDVITLENNVIQMSPFAVIKKRAA